MGTDLHEIPTDNVYVVVALSCMVSKKHLTMPTYLHAM